MRTSARGQIFGVVVTVASIVALGSAAAVDTGAIVKQRQATMKQQGKDMGGVKAFLDGKSDQAAAVAAATSLTETTRKIPDLFAPGTDQPSPDGDYGPKAAIWTDWNKFLDAQKAAATRADALLAAVKGGDKTAIQAAFADLGKNGCGNCHTNFREKLKN